MELFALAILLLASLLALLAVWDFTRAILYTFRREPPPAAEERTHDSAGIEGGGDGGG